MGVRITAGLLTSSMPRPSAAARRARATGRRRGQATRRAAVDLKMKGEVDPTGEGTLFLDSVVICPSTNTRIMQVSRADCCATAIAWPDPCGECQREDSTCRHL